MRRGLLRRHAADSERRGVRRAARDRERIAPQQRVSDGRCNGKTDREYRSAIQELRRDPERGFQKLEEIGAIREVPWADRARSERFGNDAAVLRCGHRRRMRSDNGLRQ